MDLDSTQASFLRLGHVQRTPHLHLMDWTESLDSNGPPAVGSGLFACRLGRIPVSVVLIRRRRNDLLLLDPERIDGATLCGVYGTETDPSSVAGSTKNMAF